MSANPNRRRKAAAKPRIVLPTATIDTIYTFPVLMLLKERGAAYAIKFQDTILPLPISKTAKRVPCLAEITAREIMRCLMRNLQYRIND